MNLSSWDDCGKETICTLLQGVVFCNQKVSDCSPDASQERLQAPMLWLPHLPAFIHMNGLKDKHGDRAALQRKIHTQTVTKLYLDLQVPHGPLGCSAHTLGCEY